MEKMCVVFKQWHLTRVRVKQWSVVHGTNATHVNRHLVLFLTHTCTSMIHFLLSQIPVMNEAVTLSAATCEVVGVVGESWTGFGIF